MGDSVKKIAIIGSTGSIGQQTLDVVRALPGYFRVIALAAGQNIELLTRQAEEFQPQFISCRDRDILPAGNGWRFMSLEDIANHPEVETVVIATSGNAGLKPTLAAVKAGKQIALANKESLVAAGEIITREARLSGARILPVDSEHSAIWQCLQGEIHPPSRIILTASGGPFRNYSAAELSEVTAGQALNHPSWRMGRKVTIDSATLMNKGLEIIEARWLFDMPVSDIQVVIHPQSIIHSMVEFADGAVKAQMSYPDMRLPIQYALTHPERLPNPGLPRLDWNNIRELTFEPPDPDTFTCLRLAIEAAVKGGTYPAVLCAADEVAVELFLAGRIKFTDIARLVEETLSGHEPLTQPDIEAITAADIWARNKVHQLIKGDN